MDSNDKGLATIDFSTMLTNATAVWKERQRSHVAVAADLRAERDHMLATMIGGSQDTRARAWAAGEMKALVHDHAAAAWGARLKTAETDNLLLVDGSVEFNAEFRALLKAGHESGRIRHGQPEPMPGPEMTLRVPSDVGRYDWSR